MRYVFNYPCKVAVVTPEGDLAQLRFGVGEVVETACPPTCTLQADHRQYLNLELVSGYTLVNVPIGAIRIEPMCVRAAR
jgi:hypothetical protein